MSEKVRQYQAELIDRAVRYARENEVEGDFEEAMKVLFPDVDLVDSEGRGLWGDEDTDAAYARGARDTEKAIMDRAIRAARQSPGTLPVNTINMILNYVLPGVAKVDSAGKGL
jgi:hypothetical protein